MTKSVRIENADTNTDKKLVVEVWSRGTHDAPQQLQRSVDMGHPTHMETITLHEGVYIVIREASI